MNQQRLGTAYAMATYFLWGVLPLFWKQLGSVDPFIILAHRIVWSAVFLQFLHRFSSQDLHPLHLLQSPRLLARTICYSALISANWGVYIWAVGRGLVTECSLGYFMAPIGFALLGIAIFGERPNAFKIGSISLAVIAVALRIAQDGRFEPVSVLLMLTICIYGAAKKGTALPAAQSVFLETIVMLPAAAAFLVWRAAAARPWSPTWPLGTGLSDIVMLILSGPVTAVPLLFFGEGIKRISLTAQGVVQYLSPTLQFLIAVFIFHEPWTPGRLTVFALIWTSVAIYLLDILVIEPRRRQAAMTDIPIAELSVSGA